MTFGVWLALSALGILFASFCGALVGAWIGVAYRPLALDAGLFLKRAQSRDVLPLPERKAI